MAFGFRFYGHSPRHWSEGANLGHTFDVQFERAPSGKERARLAEAWFASTKDGVLEGGEWTWADRFVQLVVGERFSAKGALFIGATAKFLDRAHRIVRIVDVVYINAHDGSGAWDRWSLKQQQPTPGPGGGAQALCGEFRRPVDKSLPEYTADEVFDAAVAACASAQVDERVGAALQAPKKKGQLGARRASVAEPPRPKYAKPTFHVVESKEKADGSIEWPVGDYPISDVLRRPIAWVKKRGVYGSHAVGTVAWLVGKRRKEATVPGNGEALALDSSGEQALIVQRKVTWDEHSAVHHLDLRTGKVHEVYAQQDDDGYELGGAAFVVGERWAILSTAKLRLFRAGAVPQPITAAVVKDGRALHAVCGGRLLIVEQDDKLSVWSADAKRLTTFDAPLEFAFEADGQVYLRHGAMLIELLGVDEVLAAQPAADRIPGRSKAKGKLQLAGAPEPLPPLKIPPGAAKKLKATHSKDIVISNAGRTVAMHDYTSGAQWRRLSYLDDAGKAVDISKALQAAAAASYFYVQGVSIEATGRFLFALKDGNGTHAARIDTSNGKVELIEQAVINVVSAVDENQVLVMSDDAVGLYQRVRKGKWDRAAERKLARPMALSQVVPANEGWRVAAVTGRKTLLLTVKDGAFKTLGTLAAPLCDAEWRGSSLFAKDAQERWWRVEGV
jgi:hypothetical protein